MTLVLSVAAEPGPEPRLLVSGPGLLPVTPQRRPEVRGVDLKLTDLTPPLRSYGILMAYLRSLNLGLPT